jgi:hypothetical protein
VQELDRLGVGQLRRVGVAHGVDASDELTGGLEDIGHRVP